MSARNELLGYLATCIGTIVVLFGLQHLYESYLDVHVVHAEWNDSPMDGALAKARGDEAQRLDGGRVPLDRAIKALASRPAQIAPQPSDDLSAMSGWVRRKGFAPYTPRSEESPPVEASPDTDDASKAADDASPGADAVEQKPEEKAGRGVRVLGDGRAPASARELEGAEQEGPEAGEGSGDR